MADADGERCGSESPRYTALRTSMVRVFQRPRSIAVLVAVPVVAILAGLIGWQFGWEMGVDSAVYRAGAVALVHGEPLYDADTLGAEPPWALLPFTYPPVAALLFTPLSTLALQPAWGILAAISCLAMAAVIRVAIGYVPRPSPASAKWASPARATLALSIVLLGLEPVWRTIFLGQINLVLLALVVLDVLVVCARGSRLGGVLVGVAAAVKLTPLIFVPHLLFTGRRKEALRALGTFVGLQGLMFLLIPHDAARFWTHAVSDPARTGPIHWAGNQSLNGLVNRLTDLAPWSLPVALGVAALLAVPAIWLMRRFHRRGQALAALLVTAFYGLLVSPVSWSHHWVWVVPLLVLLVFRALHTDPGVARKRWFAAAGVLAVFVSCVLLALPNGDDAELRWSVWQYVLGSAYLLVPVVAGAVLMVRWARWRGSGSGNVSGGIDAAAG